MKLSELARELGQRRLVGDAEIGGLCTDSRVAEKGDLFFCYRGEHVDLHEFAQEALARGAEALVCERELPFSCAQLILPDGREGMARIAAAFYGHPERKMKFVGVTGTNGKTTVTYLLRSVLGQAGFRTGIIGTLGAVYGRHFVAPALTTPDPVGLFSLLAGMRQAGVEIVVMEVSAHALALKKECPIYYDVAVFTNLTRDHLDFFGTMERYGEAKRLLFTPSRCRCAVLNADDPFSAVLKQGVIFKSYGLETPADSFALIEREDLRGSRITLNLSDELCEAELPLAGRHNVLNALAAATAARKLGVNVEDIARGLTEAEQVDGRLEWTASYRGADIFVDFAHTPDGLEKSLAALRPYCAGRLIVLFGCGGNRDAGKREQMGETAAKGSDFAVLTSDNPRYEDPCAIITEIEKGFRRHSDRYVCVEEREKAIAYALGRLREGDVLLIAGKGGETYQEIMGIKYAYNDKTVLRSMIGQLQ